MDYGKSKIEISTGDCVINSLKNIDNFDYDEFELIRKMDCWFSDEYMIAEIRECVNAFSMKFVGEVEC